jgi:crotonobetainyl-CoA:carnitine CoA-transferase CaiB-like acyl-CoA transferase
MTVMTTAAAALPLAGIKVVEIAQNLAGPFAGEILATLGADVVKVERPEGDDARGWGPPFVGGAAATFQTVNRNKRSVALDLKDARAIAWLKDYLLGCDVLVQNLRPGAMDGLDLDAESLRAANPRLIYCSLHAFGREGPMRLHPGYEPIVQAFAADPQTAAIGALAPLPDLPELRTVGLPVSFDGVRPPHRHRAPALGADNEALGAPVPEAR